MTMNANEALAIRAMNEARATTGRRRDLESRIAQCLIDEMLVNGRSVSVHDGEAWTLKRSTNAAEIFNALQTTEMDTLRLRDSDGRKIGTVTLIWGNGRDLISDSSSTGWETDAQLIDCICDRANLFAGAHCE